MNYYYPYLGYYPYMTIPQRTGLFSSLFRGGGLSSLISGTQRTLGVINQAIPVIRQVRPVVNNAKTMFKVMNEFKKNDTLKQKKNVQKTTKKTETNNTDNIITNEKNAQPTDGPTFFI